MINLLKEDYIQHFKLTGNNYQVKYTILKGRCILFDPKACDPCISSNKQQCDGPSFKQNFIMETKETVCCVDIESFMKQFDGTKAASLKKCDLMLFDDNKLSFLDMYCGQEKFLLPYNTTHHDGSIEQKKGKLATVRQQIITTIDKLCEVPSINSILHSFSKKEGLFGYRRKNTTIDVNNEATEEKNISIFIKTSEVVSSDLYSLLTHGFIFKVITYPDVYVW